MTLERLTLTSQENAMKNALVLSYYALQRMEATYLLIKSESVIDGKNHLPSKDLFIAMSIPSIIEEDVKNLTKILSDSKSNNHFFRVHNSNEYVVAARKVLSTLNQRTVGLFAESCVSAAKCHGQSYKTMLAVYNENVESFETDLDIGYTLRFNIDVSNVSKHFKAMIKTGSDYDKELKYSEKKFQKI